MSCCFENRDPGFGTGGRGEAGSMMRGTLVSLFVGWADPGLERAIPLGFSRTASGISPTYTTGAAQ